MSADERKDRYQHHIVRELGFEIESASGGFHGLVTVVSEMSATRAEAAAA